MYINIVDFSSAYCGTNQIWFFISTIAATIPFPVEQAIMNLSKVVGSFVEEHKAVNTQGNQRIDIIENTLNKKIENLQSDLAQKFDIM